MKKLLLSLLLVMTMGCVSAFAETITITSKPEDRTNFVANPNSTYGTATYTVSNTSFTATYVTTGGQIKVNATGASAFNLHNTTALSGIKRVTLEATLTNSSSTLGTWHMKTSADAAVTGLATTTDITDIKGVTLNNTVTFTVPEGRDASYFHINLTTKGGGTVKFTKIEIEYTNSGTVDPVDPDALANLVIQYGDVTVSENDEISVATGTEFNISADNAESITIMDENMDELSSATGNTCTWAPNEVMDGVNITVTATKGDQTIETTFTLTVEEPDTRAEANLSFAEATVNFDINDEFVQQELTNTNDLTVTWSSTNADVASIDAETGEITIIATGTTVIRATFEGDDTTKPGYAEYTLNVNNRNIHVVTFNFTTEDYGMIRHTQSGDQDFNDDPTTFGNGWIGVKATGKNRLWSDKGLRVWTNATVTVYAPEGCTLTDVRVLNANGSVNTARTNGITIDEPKATATYNHTNSSNSDLPQIEVSYTGATDEELATAFQAGSSLSLTVKDDEVIEGTYMKTADANAEVSITNVYPHATIYYSWTPEATETPEVAPLAAEAGYTKYTTPLSLDRAGTLSYYAELNGQRTGNKTLTITGPTTTGISEIEVDGVATEWFDLSGRRVAAPAKGVYLRKQGAKVTKIAY